MSVLKPVFGYHHSKVYTVSAKSWLGFHSYIWMAANFITTPYKYMPIMEKDILQISKGSQLIPNVHFYANFLLCFALVLTIVLQMTWNRTEILLSHNRFYSCSNAIQILLQPASGVLHFWVSLHLHVIHTLKMYILSLNQFISVHERHFLEILCYSFWFMMYFMEDIF